MSSFYYILITFLLLLMLAVSLSFFPTLKVGFRMPAALLRHAED